MMRVQKKALRQGERNDKKPSLLRGSARRLRPSRKKKIKKIKKPIDKLKKHDTINTQKTTKQTYLRKVVSTMTKRENFVAINSILNDLGNHDFDEFISHEIELLEKKTSYKSSKPTKRQTENEAVKSRIAEVLTDEGQTVTEILTQLGDGNLTNQRVSALLRQMNVHKEVVKGKSLFSLA